jgi:hypothetical protein
MFGGLDPTTLVISNSMYSLDLGQFPNAKFTAQTPALAGNNWNGATAVGARYAHDCQLASSFPFIGVSTPVVLMFGGMTDAGPTNDLIAFDDVNSRVCPQTDGEAKAISTRAIISSPSFIVNHTINTYSD